MVEGFGDLAKWKDMLWVAERLEEIVQGRLTYFADPSGGVWR